MRTTKRIALSSALIAVMLIFIQCSGQKQESAEKTTERINTIVVKEADSVHIMSIAFVEYDSLLAKYDYAQNLQTEILREEMSISNAMQQKRERLQEEMQEFDRKMQNNLFASQEQAQAAYEEIMSKEHKLAMDEQEIIAEFEKESQEKYRTLSRKITTYINKYNESKGYDFILTKMGGNILYANQAFNITDEIVAGLNKEYANELASAE